MGPAVPFGVIEARSDDPRVRFLIGVYERFCAENTPAGGGHPITGTTLDLRGIRYWLAFEGDEPLGCIGLKALGCEHGEIKTMHVLAKARGRGVGAALIERVLLTARADGLARLSLETGRSDGFAASRRLCERMGFEPCPPFGAYVVDPFSYCMTRSV